MTTKMMGVRVAAGFLFVAASLAFGQQTGNLKVKTTTGRAGVFVDDKYVGPAANFGVARTYAVPAGEHTITLRDPRFEAATTHVTIVAGKTVKVKQELKPLPPPKGPFGRIRTEGGDKYWAVYVNDAYMGHVDEFDNAAQGLLLPPGQYKVKIVPPNGGSATEQTVDLKANETTIVRVSGKA